jgi:hypothetical protein
MFFIKTPIAQEIRVGIDKWDCITLKSFCKSQETITRMKRQPIEWEKIVKLFIKQGINIQNI